MKRNARQQQAHIENVTLLSFLAVLVLSLLIFVFGIEVNNDTLILLGGLSSMVFGAMLFILAIALPSDR